MDRRDRHWARRDILKGAVAASLGSVAAPAVFAAVGEPKRQSNLIRDENSKEGTFDWQLKRLALQGDPQLRSKLIEGYCSHQSIKAGETLKVMVSVAPECDFTVEIFRMGYYGGAGARKLAEYGPIAARTLAKAGRYLGLSPTQEERFLP